MLAQGLVIPQQLITAQHQLTEIHHAFALALVFVQLVKLDLLARLRVAHHHIFGTLSFLFATGDEPLHLLGRKAFIIDIELFEQALDCRQLVLCVQNLKCLRQIRQLPMRPQKPVAQAVERANPHAAHIHRQHGAQARQHFLGRFVGEGDRHQTAGRDLTGLQKPGDARGQHPRLAGSGTGQYQRVLSRQSDGGLLFGVEAL